MDCHAPKTITGAAAPRLAHAGAPFLLASLSSQLDALAAGKAIDASMAHSLAVKLDAARASLQRGQTKAAASQPSSFVNEVQAMVRSGRLSPAGAQGLIETANRAVSAISSSP